MCESWYQVRLLISNTLPEGLPWLTKYIPLSSLDIVGSWTAVFPVTLSLSPQSHKRCQQAQVSTRPRGAFRSETSTTRFPCYTCVTRFRSLCSPSVPPGNAVGRMYPDNVSSTTKGCCTTVAMKISRLSLLLWPAMHHLLATRWILNFHATSKA